MVFVLPMPLRDQGSLIDLVGERSPIERGSELGDLVFCFEAGYKGVFKILHLRLQHGLVQG